MVKSDILRCVCLILLNLPDSENSRIQTNRNPQNGRGFGRENEVAVMTFKSGLDSSQNSN